MKPHPMQVPCSIQPLLGFNSGMYLLHFATRDSLVIDNRDGYEERGEALWLGAVKLRLKAS